MRRYTITRETSGWKVAWDAGERIVCHVKNDGELLAWLEVRVRCDAAYLVVAVPETE